MTTQQTIWQAALKKLNTKPVSCQEMKQFLMRKFPEEEGLVSEAIEELVRVDLLNDNRLLEQLVHHLIQKPIGRYKIENEVKKKALDVAKLNHILSEKNWDEAESAQKAIGIKVRTLRETDPRKRQQKIMMFLKSRGFSHEVIYSVASSFS